MCERIWTQPAQLLAEANYTGTSSIDLINTADYEFRVLASHAQANYDGSNYVALVNSRIQPLVTNVYASLPFSADVYLMVNWQEAEGWNSLVKNESHGHFSVFHPQRLTNQSGQGSNGWFVAGTWFGGPDPLSNQIPAWSGENPSSGDDGGWCGYHAAFKAVLRWSFRHN